MDSFFTKLALSNEPRQRIGRHVLFWTMAWIFQGLIYGFLYDANLTRFLVSFSEAALYLPMHMFLGYAINYYVLPRYLFKERYWLAIVNVLALILLTAMLCPPILIYWIEPFREWIGTPSNPKSPFYAFMGGLRGALTVTGFFVAIKLVKHWYLKKMENERLEKEKLRAELELLKGQLHPHFMFNTLNSIYAMALRNSEQTASAIHKLSDLMRYMISECSLPVISLEKELQVLQTYVELEKSRLGSRLDHSFNVQGSLSDRHIAPLLLLPFVENSFKHGAYVTDQTAWVSLDVSVTDERLHFKLINGKPGGEKPPGVGLGLANVKKRLSLLYPNAHELRISEDEDSFIVSLTIILDKIAVAAA